VGELGSRGLIDWSRAVIDGVARQICHGQLCNPRCWLGRLSGWVAGGGLGVLSGWCCLGGALRPRPRSGHPGGTGWVWRSHGSLPVYVMIVVGATA
jgi:hypothetical protein